MLKFFAEPLKNQIRSRKHFSKGETGASEIAWKRMTGMRDKLIHAYFGIDAETLWKAVKDNIPPLKKSIQKMLKDHEKR